MKTVVRPFFFWSISAATASYGRDIFMAKQVESISEEVQEASCSWEELRGDCTGLSHIPNVKTRLGAEKYVIYKYFVNSFLMFTCLNEWINY